jgi:hypothetical protein
MKRIGLCRAGVAALTLLTSSTAFAGSGHQWGDYLWQTANVPLKLDVAYRFANNAWVPYYQAALVKWEQNSRSPLDLTDRGQDSGTDPAVCTAKAGMVLVCAAAYGQTGWVGIAEIELNGIYIP